MTVLISPWSRQTEDKKPNPKNYNNWFRVVEGLRANGLKVTQLSCKGEPTVENVNERHDNLKLKEIVPLIEKCDTWISVDNFFQHMAWTIKQPGVVIFGLSDPEIFGHPENINLLKDRRYLREKQFWLWSQVDPNPEAFISPEAVIAAAMTSVILRKSYWSKDLLHK